MKSVQNVFLLAMMICLALFAVACGGDDEESSANGAELYATTPGGLTCASCHGATGAGDGPSAASYNPAPTDFTGSYAGSAADIEDAIRNGSGQMPGYSGLSDAQVDALVTYVLSL